MFNRRIYLQMVDFSVVILSFFGGVTGMSSPSHVNKNCHGTVKYSGAFPGRQSPKACLAVFAGRNTRERTFKKSLKKLKVSEDCKYLYIHIHIYQMHVYMHISYIYGFFFVRFQYCHYYHYQNSSEYYCFNHPHPKKNDMSPKM